jgi:glycosyltransferase involved in cell wall biosynthesis
MRGNDAGVSACFPAFNDAGSIRWVARRARAALEGTGREFEIVILNDGSVDETAEVLERLAGEIPELRLLRHRENRGYGATLRHLFAAARFPLVVYTDGDGQFDPFELTRLLDAATPGIRLVNGFRTQRTDGFLRRLLGPRFHRVVAATFGLPNLRDWDCDFRLFRRDLQLESAMSFDDGTAVVEFLAALGDRDVRFAEVEVSHSARRAGESQYFRPQSVISGHRNLWRLWRRRGSPRIRLESWWGGAVR